jgi:hypothetical protein
MGCRGVQFNTDTNKVLFKVSTKKVITWERCQVCENPSGLWEPCEAPYRVTATFAGIQGCGADAYCPGDPCAGVNGAYTLALVETSSSHCVWQYYNSGTGWKCRWGLYATYSGLNLWNDSTDKFCFYSPGDVNGPCETDFENQIDVGECTDLHPPYTYCGYDGTGTISW